MEATEQPTPEQRVTQLEAERVTARVVIKHREEDIERLKRLNGQLGRLPEAVQTLLNAEQLVANTLTADAPALALELLMCMKTQQDLIDRQTSMITELRGKLI